MRGDGLTRCRFGGALLLLVGLQAQAAAASESPCSAGASPETAQRLFAVVNQALPRGGACVFEGISTDHARLVVRWSNGGKEGPPIQVTPLECVTADANAGDGFRVEVPKEFDVACPEASGLRASLGAAIRTERPAGALARPTGMPTKALRVIGLLLGAAILLFLLGRLTGVLPARAGPATLFARRLGHALFGREHWTHPTLRRLVTTGAIPIGGLLALRQPVPAICLALVIVPALLGLVIGRAIRQRHGRVRGVLFPVAALLLPPVVFFLIDLRWPVVGLWDTTIEGLVLGVAIVMSGHAAFQDRRRIALMLFSFGVGLLALEVTARLSSHPAPLMDERDGPHLFFTEAFRNGPHARNSWLVARTITCAVLYGDERGTLSDDRYAPSQLPATIPRRSGARYRVLHLGDSLVSRYSVKPSDVRFVDLLNGLDPDVEHLNGGIPGTGPDGYLVTMRAWLARNDDIDVVVMYLFSGNDVSDTDGPHPCAGFQSIYVIEGNNVRLRYPNEPDVGLRHAPWQWLVYFSPPPYLLRATLRASRTSALLIEAMTDASSHIYMAAQESLATKQQHIAALLREARAETDRKGIKLVVVVLPIAHRVLTQDPHIDETILTDATREAGIQPWTGITAYLNAPGDHADLFRAHGDDHLGPLGDQALTRWLHPQLRALLPPRAADSLDAGLR